ncbi:MAG: hypothetical protein WCI96_12070, partial [Planctomycetota bacterium]
MSMSKLSALNAFLVSSLFALLGWGVATPRAEAQTDCVTTSYVISQPGLVASGQSFTTYVTSVVNASIDAGGEVSIVATGFTASNLNYLALNAVPYTAFDGISGSLTLTSAVTQPNMSALLQRTCLGATVAVNAASMSTLQVGVADEYFALVDTLTNLAADKTLSLGASEVSGQTVSGTGSVSINSSTLSGTSDLRNIASTINLTVPSPFTVSGGSSSLSIRGNQLGSLSFDGGGALVIDGAMGTNDLATRASGVTLSFLNSSVSTGSTVTLTAAQANGQAISGAGTTSISGNILASANFTQISTTLNIPGQVNLAATLTLTAAQANGRTLTGAGNIFITTAALTSNTTFRGLNTAEVAFSGSIASGNTLSINAFQATMSVSGAGTVDVLCTAAGDTVAGSSLTANVIASGLAGADSITSSSGNDTLSGGDDSDTIAAGAGTNSIDGGAGIDNALLSSTYATTTFSAPSATITVSSTGFTDSITTVETITCSDATVNVIGTGGSLTASLNDALESHLSGKLYGNLAIDATTFTTAAELNAITARIVTNSVVTVNALNMSATQLDAVSANAAYINSISNLTVTASNSAADITTLFSKTANGSVLVNALTMSADQKGSVAAGIVKVSAISNLTLASSEDATEMGQLFSKTADLAVAVNALAMSGDQKDAMSSSFGKISVITALTFASSEDASQITTFASKTTGAVAVATGMSSAQLSALGAVATSIAADGITGTLAIDVAVT